VIQLNTRELAGQVLARCSELATLTETAGIVTRTFLSPPMRECHRRIGAWMQTLGLQTEVDAVGNLRASPVGSDVSSLLIGSHIDTIPNAGAYDGVLGVVLGLALVEACRDRRLPFAIGVIAFSEEEGVRFRVPFLGSRALLGTVDAQLLALRDANDITVEQAIRDFGLDPREMENARLCPNTFAYLEFHIEQGPVLDNAGLSLAAVESIAGQSRLTLTFSGKANHAGTTPMEMRQDALAGAAEWISAVEEYAQRSSALVATVGHLGIEPGASNIIPAQVKASLDVRHSSDIQRHTATKGFLQQARTICARRHLQFSSEVNLEQEAVSMNPELVAAAERAITAIGEPPMRMVSGAGHDAMILAGAVPSAMIFLRSPGGISHHPDESVLVEDVEKAILAGVALLEELAKKF
jgi:allantoate deiminase